MKELVEKLEISSRLCHDYLELSLLCEYETFWWQLMLEGATIVLPLKSFEREWNAYNFMKNVGN